MSTQNTSTIYLAGGCFWGVEEMFRQIPGVLSTCCGYANGTGKADADYKTVCTGTTGFRETVRVEFDPEALPLDKLLWAYFHIINPSVANRQGNDIGTQYQTGIYWATEDSELGAQVERIAEAKRQELVDQRKRFLVEIKPLTNFFAAEDYHQEYLIKNPGGYCHVSRAEMDEVLAALA